MPKVTFLPANETVEFHADQMSYLGHGKPRSLLDVALHFDVNLEHACGGNCACTTCHVIVREGLASLNELDENEEDLLDRAWGLEPNSRLSCQAFLAQKDVVVEIPKYSINHAKENH